MTLYEEGGWRHYLRLKKLLSYILARPIVVEHLKETSVLYMHYLTLKLQVGVVVVAAVVVVGSHSSG